MYVFREVTSTVSQFIVKTTHFSRVHLLTDPRNHREKFTTLCLGPTLKAPAWNSCFQQQNDCHRKVHPLKSAIAMVWYSSISTARNCHARLKSMLEQQESGKQNGLGWSAELALQFVAFPMGTLHLQVSSRPSYCCVRLVVRVVYFWNWSQKNSSQDAIGMFKSVAVIETVTVPS